MYAGVFYIKYCEIYPKYMLSEKYGMYRFGPGQKSTVDMFTKLWL